jgi:hypothetical protein
MVVDIIRIDDYLCVCCFNCLELTLRVQDLTGPLFLP